MLSLESIKLNNLAKNRLSRLEIYKSLCLQIEVMQADQPLTFTNDFAARLRQLRHRVRQYSFRPISIGSQQSIDRDAAYSWVGVNRILSDRRLLDYKKQHLLNLFQQIITIPQFPMNIETIFSPKKNSSRIKLFQINLACGPVYAVLSGHDRVGACYLAGLQQIPCEVVNIQ